MTKRTSSVNRKVAYALEPRTLFDGAALADVLIHLDGDNADAIEASLPVDSSEFEPASEAAVQAAETFILTANREDIFAIFNGGKSERDAEWDSALDAHQSDIQNGSIHIALSFRSDSEMQGALGAFASEGIDGNSIIFLNQDWIQNDANSLGIQRVVSEELGHYFDFRLNAVTDSIGDEGEIFANTLTGTVVSADRQLQLELENDVTQLLIDGENLVVETAQTPIVSLTFETGYLGIMGKNPNQANDILNLDSLDIDRISFSQSDVNGDGLFGDGGTQGNDLAGTITFYLKNATGTQSGVSGLSVLTFEGALNWRETTGSTVEVFGFILDPGESGSFTYSSGAKTFNVIGDTTNNVSTNIGLQTYTSSWTFTDSEDRKGNAASSGLLDELNAYLNDLPKPVTITGDTVEEGNNLVYSVTLSATTPYSITYLYDFSGSATTGSDFSTSYTFSSGVTNNGDGTITVASGVDSFTVTVVTNDDSATESTETLDLNIGSVTGNGLITDNDDGIPPTISITSSATSLKAGETATITFTLSEASTNFVLADIDVAGGTLSSLSTLDNIVYTATFTPTSGSNANGVIQVNSGKFTDATGNANTDGYSTGTIEANNTVTLSIDTIRPTIGVVTSAFALKSGETATITFTLSEPSTDFTAADVTVFGGTLSGFSGSGTTYTATFTPSAGSTANGVIKVDSASFTDSAGNANPDEYVGSTNSGTEELNNTTTLTIDTVKPTVAVTFDGGVTALKAGETATVRFTLSEASSDFVQSDVEVSGGTLSNWTAVSSSVYTATFTPLENSTTNGVVKIDSGKFSDAAGNINEDEYVGSSNSGTEEANNTGTLSVDTKLPTVAISSDVSALKSGETATITFTLSESSSNFAWDGSSGDVIVSGGTLSALSTTDNIVYTATFTPSAGSTTNGVIKVDSASFTDSAGNANPDEYVGSTNSGTEELNNTTTLIIDTVKPTVAVTFDGGVTALKAGETATVRFTLSEASSDFVQSDVEVSGGTLSNWTAVSSSVYTATFTPLENSTTNGVVKIDSGKFSDAAGNINEDEYVGSSNSGTEEANNTGTLTVNTVRPTIALSKGGATLTSNGNTETITFTFSEAPTGFDLSDVAVTGGTLSALSGSGTTYTATFTVTDITKPLTAYVASNKFTNAAGNANLDGADTNNSITMSVDSRTIDVVGGLTFNEEANFATFSVIADAGSAVELSLGNTSATSDVDADISGFSLYFSVDSGSSWTEYTWNGSIGNLPTAPSGGTILVRVDITSENELTPVFEGSETFTLQANYLTNLAISDLDKDTIIDDGTGTGGSDDDRTIAVTSYGPVNEGSGTGNYAMFTVDAIEGYSVDLALQSTASGSDTEANFAGFTVQYSTDGSNWTTYSSSNKPTAPASGQVFVRVNIDSEVDSTFEKQEYFALKASYTTNTSNNAVANTSIVDDGTGTRYPGTVTGGTPNSNTTSLDDDRQLAVVSGGTFNEDSAYATFTVTGEEGYKVDLTLANTASGSDVDATISGFTFEYSTDGGTNWTTYSWNGSSGNRPTLPAGGSVLVRVDISSETDSTYEGAETFELRANYGTNPSINASAVDTIIDDGTGKRDENGDGDDTDGGDESGPYNDDRTIAVTSYGPVNEGSGTGNYAMFTVDAIEGYSVDLALQSTASGSDTEANFAGFTVQYSTDGSNWTTYSSSNKPTAPASGQVFVRVNIDSEVDSTFEKQEYFALKASYTTNTSNNAVANTSIVDDGTGTRYPGTVTGGTPNSNTTSLDDDRPSFSVSDVVYNEAAGSLVFRITRVGTTNFSSNIDYTFASGTATGSGTDFSAVDGSLTFNSSETSKTVSVSLVDDGVYEGSETLYINLNTSTVTNATVSDPQGLGVITDDGTGTGGTDDDRPAISLSDPSITEGGVLTFTGTLSKALSSSTLIDLNLKNLTAGDSDYEEASYVIKVGATPIASATNRTVQFSLPASTTTFTVEVTTTSDVLYEADETLQLVAAFNASELKYVDGESGTTRAVYTDTGTGTITNDDAVPTAVSVNDVTVNEGSNYVVFDLSGPTNSGSIPTEVSLSLANIDANNLDLTQTLQYWNGSSWTNYNGTSVTLDNDGFLKVRASIVAEQEAALDTGEQFKLNVTNIKLAGISDTSSTFGTATIQDDGTGVLFDDTESRYDSTTIPDDDRPLIVNDIVVNERSPFGVFTVGGNSGQLVQLSLATTGTGTGHAEIDKDVNTALEYYNGSSWVKYTSGSYVTMPANTMLVRMAISNDSEYENSETLKLVASNTGGSDYDGTATIKDDYTGKWFDGTSSTGNSSAPSGKELDDDRPIDVVAYGPINENSQFGMFTVTTVGTSPIVLTLIDTNTSGAIETADLGGPSIEYSLDGSTWQTYSAAFTPGQSKFFVRIDITNESDDVWENSESFSLKAQYNNHVTRSDTGRTTIVDSGNGLKYGPDVRGGSPQINGLGLDDDRPGRSDTPSASKPVVIREYEAPIPVEEAAYVLDAVRKAREELNAVALADAMETDAQRVINQLTGGIALYVIPAVNEARADTVELFRRLSSDSSNTFLANSVDPKGDLLSYENLQSSYQNTFESFGSDVEKGEETDSEIDLDLIFGNADMSEEAPDFKELSNHMSFSDQLSRSSKAFFDA